MFIYGKPGNPATYGCAKDFASIAAKLEKKLSSFPGVQFFILSVPGVSHVYVSGVKGRPDMFCAYTTREEAMEQNIKWLKFFSPREVYLTSFHEDDDDDHTT